MAIISQQTQGNIASILCSTIIAKNTAIIKENDINIPALKDIYGIGKCSTLLMHGKIAIKCLFYMNFPKYYNKLNLSEVKSEHLQTEINQQLELTKYCIIAVNIAFSRCIIFTH